MKVIFARQTLLAGTAMTQNLVSGAGTLPILSNVLLEAGPDGVNLTATDLEAFARVALKGRVEEAGRATVPSKTLSDIVRRLPDDDVVLVTSGTRMTLTCNRNVYHLATMDAEDFPEWPRPEPTTKLTLRQADLKRLLGSTLFAIPAREPRKVLMGALFQLKKDGLICVATDGRKLGKAVAEPARVEGKKEFHAIVPGRILGEIDKNIGEEGEIELAFTDRQGIFKLNDLTYVTQLIEGSFPKYDSVIPETFKKTIDLPKATLDDAISRAGILAERKFNSVILSFARNAIDVQSKSFEDGSYEGQIEIDYDGEPFKIAFNHQYLHEVFRIVRDEKIRMKVKDPIAPVVFECDSDPTSLYLVMPVRMHDLEAEEEREDEDLEPEEEE